MLFNEDFLADTIELDNNEILNKYKSELDIILSHTNTFEDDRLILVRMIISAYDNGYDNGYNDGTSEYL